MAPVRQGLPLYRRPEELARRVLGALLEFALKAYGAAAALSVALSSSESVGGKVHDAVHAVPNLLLRYQQASYVVEHREQVQATLDYARDHAPDPQQLDSAVQRSSETVGRISTTFDEVTAARDALLGIRPTNVLQTVPQIKEHVQTAWAGRPSLQAIQDLEDQAQGAQAFLTQLNLQDPVVRRIYADLRTVLDNFASDEVAATLAVMGAAFALAWVLSRAVGFWTRRGRPGFVAGMLQRWGAQRFRPWYAGNLEFALGAPMYAVALERVQRDIVADPEQALDPQALADLERWFERRRAIPRDAATGGRA
ncbi:hypothetical protein [Knoellia sp. Soil729]|uniref:hypothetical protein n=1 Tax=Knoellia sp. Soil729 TaxID=1736394 RepID=UPI0006F82E75|nr:hypothetical protein [Knoellia sp. Soil729]KRE42776.1 hypothetical protein ASG74_10395 [Knoellia sp. Soil729]